MVAEEIGLEDIGDLSSLSGLPEAIMANDIITSLQNDLMRLGKPEKEAVAVAEKLKEAFSKEREKAVEACYLAGYLKGMSEMSRRFKKLLETRGEMDRSKK